MYVLYKLFIIFNVELEGERVASCTQSSRDVDPEVMIPLTQITYSVGAFTCQCMEKACKVPGCYSSQQ